MTLLPGTRLGPYEVLAPLGAGGMGEVYRARDSRLGREVAVKVLPAAYSADPDRLVRFKQEARAASKLNHPNILVIHDIGLHEGAPYIISELLEGETLQKSLSSGPIQVRKAVEYALQIAQGLAAAHDKGIVHRDLKPANLFITKDGRVKILDFGLAKLVQAEDGSTITTAPAETEPGVVMGTLAYMSPEQVRGQPADHHSDIFSFGAVLYEMLSGRRAFQVASAADTMSAILKEDPPGLVAANPSISPALERVVRHCLEKDPAQRFQSARDLAFALAEVSGPGLIRVPTHRPRPWMRPVAGVAGVLVVVAAIWLGRSARSPEPKAPTAPSVPSAVPTGGAGLPFTQQPDIASVAVLPFTDMSAEKDQEYFSDGVAEELLNALARIPGLRVTGRTSSFSFKGKNEDLRVIGQKLNVGAILEGSVRKAGNRVRITAQLVNAADGFHQWSESYDRTLDDIFAVQEDIASSVAGALKVTLLGKDEAKVRDVNVEAYNAYLQGRYFDERRSKENLEKTVGYYQQAITLDPGYALAWAWLADAYIWQTAFDYIPVPVGLAKAREAADRAAELDQNLAMAHIARSTIKRQEWDWVEMESEVRRALELEPGNAVVLRKTAVLRRILGQFEAALTLSRRVTELDPLSADNYMVLGRAAWYAGRLDEAEAASRKVLELAPEYPGAHVQNLAYVYLSQRRPELALAEAEQETHEAFRLQGLALAYHALGRENEADTALAELIGKHQSAWALQIAEVYAFRGEADRAFEWLDRAYAQRDTGLGAVKGDPLLKNLEGDARYAAFLKKMGLPL